ncbi:MAG: hypothetical protein QMC36_00915 [Patescibacteria group bacterium]
MYGWLFYVVRVLYCWIARKDFPKAREFVRTYVRKIGSITFAVAVSMGAFAYYQNEIDPAKLPLITISNGDKTVRFQGMAHIASPSFYAGVKNDIAASRNEGYVLFYEGVKPGSAENSKKFDAIMGFKFDKNLYEAMSKLYGLVPQNQAELAGHPDARDRNVDVSIDDIVKAYENRRGSVSGEPVPNFSEAEGAASDFSAELVKEADSYNSRELAVVRYFLRAMMSLVIKNRDTGEAAFAGLGKVDLFASILDDRNEVLADAIATTEEKKVFVTYGMLHFDGVFYLLQEKDPRWKIVGTPKDGYPTLP